MKGIHLRTYLTIGLIAIVVFLAVLSFPLGTWIFAALIGLVPMYEIFFHQELQVNYLVKWWLKFCGAIAIICVVLAIAFGVDILPFRIASPLVTVLLPVTLFTLVGAFIGYMGKKLKDRIRSK